MCRIAWACTTSSMVNHLEIMKIEDNLECYVQLWEKLEETFRAFRRDYKRFCVRSILKTWLGRSTSEMFLWEVCFRSGLEGYEELPMPSLYPIKHRMFLQALVSTYLDKGTRGVKLPELDRAYSLAFGRGKALNINKKKQP